VPACPKSCSGRGTCTREQRCECEQGWEGAACDDVGEVLTFEQFHDDEEALLIAGDIEDGYDVGIAEAGEGIGFLAEFFLEIGTGVAGFLADGEALDGDPSFQLAVVGTENRANAAGSELFIDLVAICH
jgi:hypothetical protein